MFSASLQSLRQKQFPPPPTSYFSHISPRIRPGSESLTPIPYFGIFPAFKLKKKNHDVSEAGKRPSSGKEARKLVDPLDRFILKSLGDEQSTEQGRLCQRVIQHRQNPVAFMHPQAVQVCI